MEGRLRQALLRAEEVGKELADPLVARDPSKLKALGREPNIQYVDMPAEIRGAYQYFTESRVENLRNAGYNAGFTSIEDGVKRYVTQFLNTADAYR